ncbi:hypothetical protein DFJ63DRAFT_313833 [Scheffersomyces coipomensis]|uniref:uncharacterized protein n=1 Tax=Scheffersomyces coipomensis TaxID=1788519 RepID=UPI00315CB002
MKGIYLLIILLINQLTWASPIAPRALVNQSDPFYLAAYKPAHSVTSDQVDQLLSIQIQQFEVIGYQVIVYDVNDGKTIGLSSTIDSKKYNITGYVTVDQYIIVTDIIGGGINYLVIDPITNKLELSTFPPSSDDKFALSRNLISINGNYTWSVCANNDTENFTDNIYFGTLIENSAYCGDYGKELVLKAIGLVSSDGSIPDYPL